MQPTYRAVSPTGLFRVKTFTGLTEKARETFLSAHAEKYEPGPVVIAPSWGAALFALTTAGPLNGGSQTVAEARGAAHRWR